MSRDHQYFVCVKIEGAVMELGLSVIIVGEMLALEPAQKPPFRRRNVAGRPPLDRVSESRLSGQYG